MPARDRLVDLYYALFIRPGLRLSPEPFLKTATALGLRRCLTAHRINLVLDVGANTGEFVRKIRRLGYHGPVVSFEPDPEVFARLSSSWGADRAWKGCCYALGDADGQRTFHVATDSRLSSLLTAKTCISVARTVSVTVKRLDTVFEELTAGIAHPRVFLKLDTQGSDVAVLRGAAGSLDRVAVLLSEISVIPIYEDMTAWHEALRWYAELGFGIRDLSVVSRDAGGHIIELDCLLDRGAAHPEVRHRPAP